ncbi:MAG: hypothetical protein AB9866_17985 [Syntrophobacteraceae bacterium]
MIFPEMVWVNKGFTVFMDIPRIISRYSGLDTAGAQQKGECKPAEKEYTIMVKSL